VGRDEPEAGQIEEKALEDRDELLESCFGELLGHIYRCSGNKFDLRRCCAGGRIPRGERPPGRDSLINDLPGDLGIREVVMC